MYAIMLQYSICEFTATAKQGSKNECLRYLFCSLASFRNYIVDKKIRSVLERPQHP